MQLTILSVAYPFAPVGPNAVGGAEQVLTSLDHAIVAAGHRSIVVACEESCTSGELITSGACQETWTTERCAMRRAQHKAAIQEILARGPVDVIHMHGVDFHEYLPETDLPVLVTLHLPPAYYPAHIFHHLPPNVHLQCVSRSQAQSCPPGTELAGLIENGVALEKLGAQRHARRHFALSVGRICPEKGYHLALEAARLAEIPLLIGGETFGYEAHLQYFRTEFLPRLDRQHRWLGPLNFQRKRRLLAAARCVLVPSLVAETSSLIAMEALACGTPVIAFPNGALADIVEPGRTGFLVRDAKEMAKAIHLADGIDREACRRAARERFAADQMTRRYLALYEELRRAGARREPLEISCRASAAKGGTAWAASGRAAHPGALGHAESGKSIRASALTRAECSQREHFHLFQPSSGETRFDAAALRPPVLLETQTALDVQLVTTIDALQALAPEWLALWRQDVRATPFQSPAWLVPWARHFTGGDLLCVALRQAGELVGLVPTFIWTIPETGQRQLVLLGTGISDYVDGVFAPGLATAGGHAALAWLIRHADCDAINFEQLRPDSPLACNVAGLDPQTPCPVLSLPACVADLGAHVPSGQLQNVRYYRRRAQRIGELQFDTPSEETLDDFMAELYALHSARWHGVQRRGVLCHDSIQSFHREACRGLFDTGSLRLYRLRCRGESVAVFYGFAAHRRTYYYLAGFAPKFASLSPGTLLIAHAIERAILEGSEAFDFLRGTERYKYLWGAKDTPTYRRSISRPELTPV